MVPIVTTKDEKSRTEHPLDSVENAAKPPVDPVPDLETLTPMEKAAWLLEREQEALDMVGGDREGVREAVKKLKNRTAVQRYKRRHRRLPKMSEYVLVQADKVKNRPDKGLRETKDSKALAAAKEMVATNPGLPRVRTDDIVRLHDLFVSFMAEDAPEPPRCDAEGHKLTTLQRNKIRFQVLLESIYEKAIQGDVGMSKLILERIIPLHKTGELEIKISASQHIEFLERMKHDDVILRFGNEPGLLAESAVDGEFDEKELTPPAPEDNVRAEPAIVEQVREFSLA